MTAGNKKTNELSPQGTCCAVYSEFTDADVKRLHYFEIED